MDAGGAAALALPVIIHLLTRHTPRRVLFPTLQFLRRARARQSRLLRLRHLVLLLLRLLLVGLLVAAFTRPVLKLPFQKALGAQGRTATLIALDLSLSMGYTGAGATPLSRAKAEALRLLQSLRDRERANVLFVAASTTAATPQLSRDLNLLREEIEAAGPTMQEADFGAALGQAVEALERPEAQGLEKELYIISDFQRTNWAGVQLDGVPREVNLFLVDVDTGEKRNTAITSVRTRPAAARVGETVEMDCEVANYSLQAQQVPVSFELETGRQTSGAGAGGRESRLRLEQQLLVPAYGSATAIFRLRPQLPGDYEGTLRIPADALKADNVRYLNLRVRKGLVTYLVTDENPEDDATGAFYLVRALVPSRSKEAGLTAKVLNSKQAAGRDLRAADAVFISNLDRLEETLARNLDDYMMRGGAVFYFAGAGEVEDQLSALDQASSTGRVTPFTVGELLEVRGLGRGFVTWREARFESPMLSLFREPEHGDLSKIRFYKFRLVTDAYRRAETLLRYEDGTPAAARTRVGAGSFVLCNFSPHPLAGDLIKHEVFPPFLHELVKGARAEEAAPQDFLVGQIAFFARSRGDWELTRMDKWKWITAGG